MNLEQKMRRLIRERRFKGRIHIPYSQRRPLPVPGTDGGSRYSASSMQVRPRRRLRLVSYNIAGIVNKKEDLMEMLRQMYKPDVVALQETVLGAGYPVRLPGYTVVEGVRTPQQRAVALAVRRPAQFFPLNPRRSKLLPRFSVRVCLPTLL